jgi:hypothetical protein
MKRTPPVVAMLVRAAAWFGLAACGSSTEPNGPATLSATTSTALNGTVGTAVTPTPVVQVLNQDGVPVAGVTVTFQVSSGDGTVTNASVVTDAAGTASAGGWVLGPVAGTNTLTASVAGLTSVVFTAQALPNSCDLRTAISVGGTAGGTLSSGDCVVAGAFTDNYLLTTSASEAVEITLTSQDFNAFLGVTGANGGPVAANDNTPGVTTTNSRIKLIAAAGEHTIAATSFDPGETGSYALQVAAAQPSSENCDLVFVERGVTTAQTLSQTDCLLFSPYFDDQFFIFLSAGSQVRITQSSEAIDAYLLLLNPNGGVVAENDDANDATLDAQIVYTATVSGFHLISASSALEEEVGAYTLTVDSPGSALQGALLMQSPRTGTGKAGGRKAGRHDR